MDKIRIKNLEIFANHGVFPEENTLGQKFVISAVLHTSTRKAGKSDELTESIHYGEVSHFIKKFVESHTWKLLESVVEHLAQALLLEYPLTEQVDLVIQKPWAPIGLPLETVSVEISRGWHTAYIALGSNMGDKKGYLDMAVKMLGEQPDCQVRAVSDYLVTEPYGGVEQDDFLNGALELRTLLEPEELLERLHEIERAANRERKVHWGPRTLDLDILLYDNRVVDTPELTIPHEEMHLRDFVLIPLEQIAPWVRHPLNGQTVKQMRRRAAGENE
ncbi:MAG: 2-amino-4-hydroxy-6-hydroxymethyldihydropteridine diphosphokinase [Clostridiales bacterium]|nr:2-amino-4-hydroxy-6-hydroxymethyldihydropteridine diphosphokinase [Clostridiales bacterium]